MGTKYDLTDDTAAIDWELTMGWENFDEPSVDKKWLRTQLFGPMADTPDYTMTVVTEKDWKTGDDTSAPVVFTGGVDLPRPLRLKPSKGKSLRHKFTHNTIYERVLLSGWEDEVAITYSRKLKG